MPEHSIAALIVTNGKTAYLDRTVDAVKNQTLQPDTIVIIDHSKTSDTDHLGPDDIKNYGIAAFLVEAERAATMGHAIRRALDEAPINDDYLWLLHDDSTPHDQCLEALAANIPDDQHEVVVGPYQYSDDKAHHLISVGNVATRYGRRLRSIDVNEIDQGQHDGKLPISGVGSAGMLLSKRLWTKLNGFDPNLGPFDDGLELCLRAQRVGARIVVAPDAHIYHAQASYLGLRDNPEGDPDITRSFTQRREATYFIRGTQLPALLFVLSGLWVVGEGLIRAIYRLLTKNIVAAVKELKAAGYYLVNFSAMKRSRGRTRRIATADVTTAADRQHRRYDKRLRSYLALSDAGEPLEPIAAKALAHRESRSTLIGWTLFVASIVVSAVAMRGWMGGIDGGAWAQLPGNWRDLWDVAWGAWVPGGDGYATAPEPILMVLSILSAPFALVGMSPSVFLIALMAFLPTIAAISAWVGFGAYTRQLGTRAFITLLWLAYPAFLVSLWHGNLAAGLIHAVLPWFVWGLGYASGFGSTDIVSGAHKDTSIVKPRRMATGAGVLAVSTTVIMMANIGLGLVLVAVIIIAAIASGIARLLTRRQHDNGDLEIYDPSQIRYRGWTTTLLAALAPLTAAIPTFVSWYNYPQAGWHILFDQAGNTSTYGTPSFYELIAGLPIPRQDIPFSNGAIVWMIILGLVVIMALVGFAQSQRQLAHMVVLVCAAGAAIIAWMATRVPVGIAPGARADNTAAVMSAWPAPFQSLMWMALLGAVGVSTHRLWSTHIRTLPYAVKVIVVGVVSLAMIVPMVFIGMWTYHSGAVAKGEADTQTMSWPSYKQQRHIPLSAQLAYDDGLHSKYIHLSAVGPQTVIARVYRTEGPSLSDSSPVIRYAHARAVYDSLDDEVAHAVASLSKSGDSQAVSTLREHGVESIMIDSCHTPYCVALYKSLETNDGLRRAQKTKAFTTWKLRPTPDSQENARIVLDDGQRLTSHLVSASTPIHTEATTTLHLRERYSPHWKAWIGMQQLVSKNDRHLTSFTIPAHSDGILTIAYSPWWLGIWHFVAVIVFVTAAIAALPIRYRREVG